MVSPALGLKALPAVAYRSCTCTGPAGLFMPVVVLLMTFGMSLMS
jgi:hypothetical protein